MIYLRGHHLICLNFFNGEGYNRAFIENLKEILLRARKEAIEVVEGADDVCGKCPFLIDGICKDEEEIREMDKVALDLLKRKFGDILYWSELDNMLPEIFSLWYRQYCIPCGYLEICSETFLFNSLRKLSSC